MTGGVVGWAENSVKGIPGQLQQWSNDLGQYAQVPEPLIKTAEHVGKDVGNWSGDFAQQARNLLIGEPDTPKKQEPTPANGYNPFSESHKSEKGKQDNKQPDPNAIAMALAGNAVSNQMNPIMQQVQNMSSMYESSMAGMNANISAEKSTGDPKLDAALKAQQSAIQSGEAGIDEAAKAMPGGIQAQESGLPYADVLATTLNLKKNELQYGTVPTQHLNTSGWSSNLQSVYDYIRGIGNTTNNPSSGADILPGISNAALGSNSTTVPAAGGAGLGQA
jgi:hypothetical protein